MRKTSRKSTTKKTERVPVGYDEWKKKAIYEAKESWVTKIEYENILEALWFRGKYYIEEGVICLDWSADYSQKNLYNPANESDTIYVDLANLDENSEEDILSFVNKYGLLGYWDKSEIGFVKLKDFPLSSWLAPKSQSVATFQVCCRFVRDVLSFYDAIGKKQHKEIRSLIPALAAYEGIETLPRGYELPATNDSALLEVSQAYMVLLVTSLLKSARLSLDMNPQQGTFSQVYRTDGIANLLSTIYLQLYWLIAGNKRLTRCPGCDNYFIPETAHKRRFCSKKCKNKINVSEWRNDPERRQSGRVK